MKVATRLTRNTFGVNVHKHFKIDKVSTRWVPRSPTVEQKQQRVDVCSDLPHCSDANTVYFMARLERGNETAPFS